MLCFSDLWAEPFADIHKVKGLQGIYIVSQVSPSMQSGSVDIGPEHIVTLISFDWGFDWRLLNVTRSFSHCEKVIYIFDVKFFCHACAKSIVFDDV